MIKILSLLLLLVINQSHAFVGSDSFSQYIGLKSTQSSAESRTLSSAVTALQTPVNFSCLDLINYWSQLFNEFFLRPLPFARRQSVLFGDLTLVYRSLVSLFNFFQITINDLRSQLSGFECGAEQFAMCKAVDKKLPKKRVIHILISQLNFFFGSNYSYNPLYALWNTGFLAYQCICRTC